MNSYKRIRLKTLDYASHPSYQLKQLFETFSSTWTEGSARRVDGTSSTFLARYELSEMNIKYRGFLIFVGSYLIR